MKMIRARTEHQTVTVRSIHPLAVGLSAVLGTLHGQAIAGRGQRPNGAIISGMATPGASKYSGYAAPQQMFVGWDPSKVAGGAIRNPGGQLPGTQAPAGYHNPVLDAIMRMANSGGAQ